MEQYSSVKHRAEPHASFESASALDEAALVAAARRDPAAFGEIYRRYVTRLYRYLFSQVGDGHEAEDLTAVVFSAAWESLPRYREQGNFAAWLFRIARNKVKDYFRRRRPTLSLEEVQPLLHTEWDFLASLEQDDMLQRLAALLEDLNPEQRELLRLRFAADLSYAQIGDLLGRSEAAVKMSVHRLLQRLQADWNDPNG